MNTFSKAERLNKKILIEKLFSAEARSFTVFPLRVVYLPVDELDVPASVLISVSKRRFKRAVKRNKVKRQIREAYRNNKALLGTAADGKKWMIAFLYLSDEIVPLLTITECIKSALQKIVDN